MSKYQYNGITYPYGSTLKTTKYPNPTKEQIAFSASMAVPVGKKSGCFGYGGPNYYNKKKTFSGYYKKFSKKEEK